MGAPRAAADLTLALRFVTQRNVLQLRRVRRAVRSPAHSGEFMGATRAGGSRICSVRVPRGWPRRTIGGGQVGGRGRCRGRQRPAQR